MTTPEHDRLATELSLLESMYPDQVRYHDKAREVSYRSEGASLQLRLPDAYLVSALPDVLSANNGKTDLREEIRLRIARCSVGEEVLDAVILAFHSLVDTVAAEEEKEKEDASRQPNGGHAAPDDRRATIAVWLHHLLNTNKRKQALSPASSTVAGVTKPGYPGVLVYSGPAQAVHEHVNELKQLNWQAFQIRLETEDEWQFTHGSGVKEVETMKEVVADVGTARKEVFMEAMRMK